MSLVLSHFKFSIYFEMEHDLTGHKTLPKLHLQLILTSLGKLGMILGLNYYFRCLLRREIHHGRHTWDMF